MIAIFLLIFSQMMFKEFPADDIIFYCIYFSILLVCVCLSDVNDLFCLNLIHDQPINVRTVRYSIKKTKINGDQLE